MANPSFSGSTVSGTGTLFVSTGTTMNATSSTLSSPVTIEGGATLNLTSGTLSGSTVNIGTLALAASTQSGPLDNFGTVTSIGTSSSSGAFTSRAGSTLRVFSDLSSNSQLTFANGFTNNGTLELIALYGATGIRNTGLGLTAGTLVNAPGGVIRSLAGNGAAARSITGPLDNQGLLEVQYPLAIALNRPASSNAGTIHLDGGDLTLTVSGATPGFSTSGTVIVPTGRTLTLTGSVAGGAGQTFTYAGGTLEGNGTLAATNATIALGTALTTDSLDVSLTGSQLTGASAMSVSAGSTLSAAGSSIVAAAVNVLNGGTMSLSASTVSGAVAVSSSGNVRLAASTQSGPLDNFGTVTAEGASNSSGAFTSRAGSTLRVQSAPGAGATLTFANGFTNNALCELTTTSGSTGIAAANLALTAGTFVNAPSGVLRSTGTFQTRGFTGPIDNQGTIEVRYPLTFALNRPGSTNSGSILLQGADLTLVLSGATPGFTTSGTISVPSGRTLTLNGSVAGGAGQNLTFAGGTLGGAGTVNITNATLALSSPWTMDSTTVNLTTSLLNGPAAVTVSTGRLNLSSSTTNAPVTVTAAGTVLYNTSTQAGALDNSGLVVVEGACTSSGTFTTGAGSTLRVQITSGANASLNFANGFTNTALWELTSAGVVAPARTLSISTTAGTVTNAATGTMRAVATASGSRTVTAPFVNAGLLDVQQSLALTRAGHAYSNTGTVNIGPGIVLAVTGASLTNQPGAVLRGSGTLTLGTGMTLTQSGIVRPGTSPGLLRVEGRVVHTPSAELEIEVAGDDPGAGFDVFSVRDSVTFAGTLRVLVSSPYVPKPGRKYVISRFSRRSGTTFGTVEGLAYGPGQLWALSYSDTNLVLDCVDQTWTRVHPDGTPPVARAGHTAVYDST
ncbi:MAG: hypothetical protein RL721_2317, partial [Candidatus Eisenbacteria bacterium]